MFRLHLRHLPQHLLEHGVGSSNPLAHHGQQLTPNAIEGGSSIVIIGNNARPGPEGRVSEAAAVVEMVEVEVMMMTAMMLMMSLLMTITNNQNCSLIASDTSTARDLLLLLR